mgnify:CR=1 FL=1
MIAYYSKVFDGVGTESMNPDKAKEKTSSEDPAPKKLKNKQKSQSDIKGLVDKRAQRPDKDKKEKTFVAAIDHTAAEEGEISFTAGEELILLSPRADGTPRGTLHCHFTLFISEYFLSAQFTWRGRRHT